MIISPIGASVCMYLFAGKGIKCITLFPDIKSPMFLSDLYCGPLNQEHKSIFGSTVNSKNTSINSSYIIDNDINWNNILSPQILK